MNSRLINQLQATIFDEPKILWDHLRGGGEAMRAGLFTPSSHFICNKFRVVNGIHEPSE